MTTTSACSDAFDRLIRHCGNPSRTTGRSVWPRLLGTSPPGRLLDIWDSSRSPSYEAFKLLTARVAALLALPAVPPRPDEISRSITLITDNRFEPPRWDGEARHLLGLQPAEDKLLRERVAI